MVAEHFSESISSTALGQEVAGAAESDVFWQDHAQTQGVVSLSGSTDALAIAKSSPLLTTRFPPEIAATRGCATVSTVHSAKDVCVAVWAVRRNMYLDPTARFLTRRLGPVVSAVRKEDKVPEVRVHLYEVADGDWSQGKVTTPSRDRLLAGEDRSAGPLMETTIVDDPAADRNETERETSLFNPTNEVTLNVTFAPDVPASWETWDGVRTTRPVVTSLKNPWSVGASELQANESGFGPPPIEPLASNCV